VAKQPPKKDDGQSPLQVALKTGNTASADYLLDMGADVNTLDLYGNSGVQPETYACRSPVRARSGWPAPGESALENNNPCTDAWRMYLEHAEIIRVITGASLRRDSIW